MNLRNINLKKIKKGHVIFLIIIIVILSIPISYLATYRDYQESYTYYYTSGSPSAVHNISIITDTGHVNVRYNSTPTSSFITLNALFHFSGAYSIGASYQTYYYPIEWENATDPLAFSLRRLPFNAFEISQYWQASIIFITLTLRTDLVYNLDLSTGRGDVDVLIPNDVELDGVNINANSGKISLHASNTNFTKGITCNSVAGTSVLQGGITLNLTSCILGDNISGTVDVGDIVFNTFNIACIKNNSLDLSTSYGDIDANIQQYSLINANITGIFSVVSGDISIVYKDNDSALGAQFIATGGTPSYINSGGFTQNGLSFTSDDYNSASNTYNLTLSGTILVDGLSV